MKAESCSIAEPAVSAAARKTISAAVKSTVRGIARGLIPGQGAARGGLHLNGLASEDSELPADQQRSPGVRNGSAAVMKNRSDATVTGVICHVTRPHTVNAAEIIAPCINGQLKLITICIWRSHRGLCACTCNRGSGFKRMLFTVID